VPPLSTGHGAYAETAAEFLKWRADVDVILTMDQWLHLVRCQVVQVLSGRLTRDQRNAIAPVPRATHRLPGVHATAIRDDEKRPWIARIAIIRPARRHLI